MEGQTGTLILVVSAGCLAEGCTVEEIEKIQKQLERDEGQAI